MIAEHALELALARVRVTPVLSPQALRIFGWLVLILVEFSGVAGVAKRGAEIDIDV
jgi:hypothetical protein